MTTIRRNEAFGRTLSEGLGEGPVRMLTKPLSFLGGVEPATGTIVDRHHPQLGASLAGCVVVMPGTRGSSGGGPVLMECLRRRTAPCAIVAFTTSQILLVGALVARELYGVRFPMMLASRDHLQDITDGVTAQVVCRPNDAVVRWMTATGHTN